MAIWLIQDAIPREKIAARIVGLREQHGAVQIHVPKSGKVKNN